MEKENTRDKPVKKLGALDLDMVKMINNQPESSVSYPANDQSTSINLPESPMQLHDIDDLKFGKAMEEKSYPNFDFKTLDISLEEIKNLSDEDLLRLLSGESHDGNILDVTVQLISNELLIRQIKEASKPHWTVKPTFYTVVFFGLITIIIGILSLLKWW